MSSLKLLEKRQLESLFGMSSGYVLDFSDRTFKDFFHEAANLDISDPSFAKATGSKANRLRTFWEKFDDPIVAKVLHELLGVWLHNHKQIENNEYLACKKIADRLVGVSQFMDMGEDDFLRKDLGTISFSSLPIESKLLFILEARFSEVNRCVKTEAYLSAIILSGSILEGVLLSIAQSNSKRFNQAKAAPKDKSEQLVKVKKFPDWSLADLIDVAYECGMLSIDVKKFSHVLRDFRNYIHPNEQMTSNFSPDKHTAAICGQVLKAAIANLSGKR